MGWVPVRPRASRTGPRAAGRCRGYRRRRATSADRMAVDHLQAGWPRGRMGSVSTPEATGYRIERDSMGEVEVPADALWRAQTQRAVQNFPISGRGIEPAQIRALAQIKGAAAQVNAELGVIDPNVAS